MHYSSNEHKGVARDGGLKKATSQVLHNFPLDDVHRK